MRNCGQIKGHPEFSFDFNSKHIIDNKTDTEVPLTVALEKLEVYISGKYKTVKELTKGVK